MEIERLWGKEHGWFTSLPMEDRIRYRAHYRVLTGADRQREPAPKASTDDLAGFFAFGGRDA